MDVICFNCGKKVGEKGSIVNNGKSSSTICIDCLIEYREKKIKKLETLLLLSPTNAKAEKWLSDLARCRKNHTKVLIERQEAK